MANTFILDTNGKVTPEDKGGPRVGIGASVTASRDSEGAIGILLLRGDGGDPEAFNYLVRARWVGPIAANVPTQIKLAKLDFPIPDFTPRTYRCMVVADGGPGVTLTVSEGIIAPEPYAPAGIYPLLV